MIEDLAEQVDVLRWIDVIMSARQHRDRTDRNARAMRRGIDATSEPRHDHETSRAKVACDPVGELRPAAEALREPTTAIMGCASAAIVPRTAISGGASSIIRSRTG